MGAHCGGVAALSATENDLMPASTSLATVSAESAPLSFGPINWGPVLIWVYSFIANVLLSARIIQR